ncbi:hypothetical protein ACJMK2_034021 [Sinanodonta woodiana]|uniref:Peroxisomal membrane protein PMP34 n=1 Tax=Sinanodonta woodiana TaxID=1069815 RepID=A0ABD3WQA9_SINWO
MGLFSKTGRHASLMWKLCGAEDKTGMDLRTSAIRTVFSYSSLVHAVAGAAGSVIAMTVFYPLDTARTILQVDDKRRAKHSPVVMFEIACDEGFSALYRGLFPVITSLCISNFVYFYTYNTLKAVVLGTLGKPDPFKDLTFAFIAGVVNVLVTTPLWVANTRLKLQGAKFETESYRKGQSKYSGMIDALLKIIQSEGLGALWNGTKPSLLLATNPAIQFMVYETVKRYFQSIMKTMELSGFLYFLIGAIAKTVATVITYPLQVIQSRLRAGFKKNDENSRNPTGIFEALLVLVRTQGIKSLYKGMEAKLIQTVFTAALMFLTYEKIQEAIFRLFGQDMAAMKKL